MFIAGSNRKWLAFIIGNNYLTTVEVFVSPSIKLKTKVEDGRLDENVDPHVLAGLLKMWLRESELWTEMKQFINETKIVKTGFYFTGNSLLTICEFV